MKAGRRGAFCDSGPKNLPVSSPPCSKHSVLKMLFGSQVIVVVPAWNAARLAGGKVLSWLTARAIGVPIRDSQCGYTAIARAACEGLDFSRVWPGYGYPNDLLAAIARAGLRIAHAPVRPVYADEVSRLR